MILSDLSIRQRLSTPDNLSLIPVPGDSQFQPASLDVRLGNEFIFFRHVMGADKHHGLDVRNSESLDDVASKLLLPHDGHVTVEPGEFVLGTTLERITMPDDLVARVEGRSSIGRLGLTVHVTAGFIDPGFKGHITLEIANLNRYPITIYVGMRIAQLAFQSMTTPAEFPYGSEGSNSKYQGQSSVTTSKIAEDEV